MYQGKTHALFAKYAIPQMIGLLFNSVYTIVDGIFIGHRLGTDSMAAGRRLCATDRNSDRSSHVGSLRRRGGWSPAPGAEREGESGAGIPYRCDLRLWNGHPDYDFRQYLN